jgi:hypothetical protein
MAAGTGWVVAAEVVAGAGGAGAVAAAAGAADDPTLLQRHFL